MTKLSNEVSQRGGHIDFKPWHFREMECSIQTSVLLSSFSFKFSASNVLFQQVSLKCKWAHFPFTLWFPAFYNNCPNKMAPTDQIDPLVRYVGLDGLWLACSMWSSGSRTASHCDMWEWARETSMLPPSFSHHHMGCLLPPPLMHLSALASRSLPSEVFSYRLN